MNVAISGAGISGLAAAISLRRCGHRVTIYERSSLNNEVGAAINVPPNVSRFLVPWGLDPVRSRLVTSQGLYFKSPTTLEDLSYFDYSHVADKFGGPLYYAHRVDLHDSLKFMATRPDGPGIPVEIRLKSAVSSYNPGIPSMTLYDGTVVTADLILAADGVNSIAVEAILGKPNPPLATENYNCCYRFLITREDLEGDFETSWFIQGHETLGCRVFPDHATSRRLVSYTCRNHEIYNFVAICHNDAVYSKNKEDWLAPVDKNEVLTQFAGYNSKLLGVMNKATEVKRWPLLYRPPIRTWHKGRMALAGDAAHPMLPLHAQAGAQGIEDGIAFGLVFHRLKNSSEIEQRLALYENIRRNRAASIQILSKLGVDEPAPEELTEFLDGRSMPSNVNDMLDLAYVPNVVERAIKTMREVDPEFKLPDGFYALKTENT